jgi:hypothetical protein
MMREPAGSNLYCCAKTYQEGSCFRSIGAREARIEVNSCFETDLESTLRKRRAREQAL